MGRDSTSSSLPHCLPLPLPHTLPPPPRPLPRPRPSFWQSSSNFEELELGSIVEDGTEEEDSYG